MADVERPQKPPHQRPTGEIPLSWALPAEDVSEASTPTSSNKSLLIAGVGVALMVGAVVLALRPPDRPLAPPTAQPPPAQPVARPKPVPPTQPAVPAPLDVADNAATEPTEATTAPTTTAPTTTAPTTTATTTTDDGGPAARLQAQDLIGRARIAARDGDESQAMVFALRAVALDPECAGCWRTVGLLRGRSGDHLLAARARARALALEQQAQQPVQ